MKKHPYQTPEARLLLLAAEDLLTASSESGGGNENPGGPPENPFWQGGPDIVFPDIPLG